MNTLGAQNSCKGVLMPNFGNEKIDWIQVLKGTKKKSRELIDVRLPNVEQLEDTHYKRYKYELLFKMLDFNRLIDNPVVSQEFSHGASSIELPDLSFSTSSDASFDTSDSSLDTSGASINQELQDDYDDCIEAVRLYNEGVKRLKQGGKKEAEIMIAKSMRMGFPYAIYAYAIIKFEEVWKSNTTRYVWEEGSYKENIEHAVNCMIASNIYFFPLNNFVLGMLQLYDIGGLGELIKNKSMKSWQGYFASVLLATKGTHLMDGIKESKLLAYIDHDTFGFVEPDIYMATMGDEKGMEDLKWMVRCIEYELVKKMMPILSNISIVGPLLRKLSSDDFADGRYLYAFSLLKGVLGKLDYKDTDEVYGHLRSSIDFEHQEAKFLFATLPFRKGFEFLKQNRIEDGRRCFYLLKDFVYCNTNAYFEETAALLVAREYLNKNGCYVTYDQEKARDILKDAGCINALEELDRRLVRQQEEPKGVLRDVLKTLKKVSSVYEESNDSELGTLVSEIEKLFRALKSSKISIQQPGSLSTILTLLDNVSFIDNKSLLPLQQLCGALEEVFEQQSHCSSKEKILGLLKNLNKMCLLKGIKMSILQRAWDN